MLLVGHFTVAFTVHMAGSYDPVSGEVTLISAEIQVFSFSLCRQRWLLWLR